MRGSLLFLSICQQARVQLLVHQPHYCQGRQVWMTAHTLRHPSPTLICQTLDLSKTGRWHPVKKGSNLYLINLFWFFSVHCIFTTLKVGSGSRGPAYSGAFMPVTESQAPLKSYDIKLMKSRELCNQIQQNNKIKIKINLISKNLKIRIMVNSRCHSWNFVVVGRVVDVGRDGGAE